MWRVWVTCGLCLWVPLGLDPASVVQLGPSGKAGPISEPVSRLYDGTMPREAMAHNYKEHFPQRRPCEWCPLEVCERSLGGLDDGCHARLL